MNHKMKNLIIISRGILAVPNWDWRIVNRDESVKAGDKYFVSDKLFREDIYTGWVLINPDLIKKHQGRLTAGSFFCVIRPLSRKVSIFQKLRNAYDLFLDKNQARRFLTNNDFE